MVEIEREYTFLVDKLPADLTDFPSKIIADNYIPESSDHPVIRIRKNGDKCEITKKHPVDTTDGTDGDSSKQVEHTIPLTEEEYAALNSLPGKPFRKRRFYYVHNDVPCELDVYLDALAGLVTVDFEFVDDAAQQTFQTPDWVGGDVSQELTIAGGMLAGKSYADIADDLKQKYNFEPVPGTEKLAEV